MERKNLEIREAYVRPEMDVVEISSEYALVTTGCGSCTVDHPEENEPGMMSDF